jgi:hypothetical protein
MANVFAPFGLKPYFGADGAAPTFGLGARPRLIAYNDTTKIYKGDPVKALNTGYVAQWTAATGVSQLAGVFWGTEYYSVSTKQPYFNNYWPGADVATDAKVTAQLIPVNTAVPPMFLIQTANSSTTAVAVTVADIGTNADVALGTGNTNTGFSGAYLDINTFNTTSTLPFKIVDIYQGAGNGNDATSAYNYVIVQANIYSEAGI